MQDVIITALLAAVTASAGLFLLLAGRGKDGMTGKQKKMMVRIFLSALLLFGLSLVVYGLLAWLMPQTYSHKLNASLDEQTVSFLAGLEEVAFSDSGGLFDQFARNREIYSMELYDDNGVLIPLPSAQAPAAYGETSLAGYGEGNVALSAEEETGEDAPVVNVPKWLDRNKNTLQGTVVAMPTRDDIDFPVEEHLIVELYSK